MKKKESYDTIKKKEGGRGAELMSLLIGLYCKLKDVTVTFSLFLSCPEFDSIFFYWCFFINIMICSFFVLFCFLFLFCLVSFFFVW